MIEYWANPGEPITRWDVMYLGDRVWPGVWSVSLDKSRSVDKAKAQNNDGYTLTSKGYAGAPVKAVGRIWTPEQLTELETFISDYDPEFSRISSPLDFYNPACEILLLSRVFIQKISVTPPVPGNKVVTITIDMDQWFPSSKIKKTKPTLPGFDGTSLASDKVNPNDFRVGIPTI